MRAFHCRGLVVSVFDHQGKETRQMRKKDDRSADRNGRGLEAVGRVAEQAGASGKSKNKPENPPYQAENSQFNRRIAAAPLKAGDVRREMPGAILELSGPTKG